MAQRSRSILFGYHQDFLSTGIELSPFKLPLQSGIFEDNDRSFGGLFGLFNDSLPDGWGLLLLGRVLRGKGVRLEDISPFLRLSMASSRCMGALEYVADVQESDDSNKAVDLYLDGMAEVSRKILAEEDAPLESVNELLRLGGSSGGARPKILADVSADGSRIMPEGTGGEGFSPWLIKFHSREEGGDQGLVEYVYSLLARDVGVMMPPTRLFPSKTTAGYFGVKRFDRECGQKLHVHTACGLLHADHRHASLDYENLIKLTKVLTGDVREVEQMARLMVFNVKAGNRDDHSKNFSFLLDSQNRWKMAPAYDLTPSMGFAGEHAAMVNGKGNDIKNVDLIATASIADIPASFIQEAIQRTEEALSRFEVLKREVRRRGR
ncbi:MAG: type II toxin-antitoxin system HipA family toxin [Desulfobulbus sp.]|nr:type II toxin-antitoxin system HipA family toxin [Desulfobulbus sp.]